MGNLTHYDYGFRIYNPAIAKFLSVDPLTKSYPWYTPYQFAGNMPISAIDLDGLEPQLVSGPKMFDGEMRTAKYVNAKLMEHYHTTMTDNYIKMYPDGSHGFDFKRAAAEVSGMLHGGEPQEALEQFSAYRAKAKEALGRWDKHLFKGQAFTKRSKEETMQRIVQARSSAIATYKDAVRRGRIDADIKIGLGVLSYTFGMVNAATSYKSFGADAILTALSIGFALDQISDGLNTIDAINEGVFQTDKQYAFVKGALVEEFGETGAVVYNLANFGTALISSGVDVATFNGDQLNKMLKAGSIAVESVNIVYSNTGDDNNESDD